MTQTLSSEARDGMLSELGAIEVTRAQLLARESQLLTDLAGQELTDEDRFGVDTFLALDLSGTCRYGQGTAAGRVFDADRLVRLMPQTLRWLGDGILAVHQAHHILRVLANATSEVIAEVDRRLTADWCGYHPAQLGRRLSRLLLTVEAQLAAESSRARRRAAHRARSVWLTPLPDGMATVGACLSAERARQWIAQLEELSSRARAADRAAGVHRTADQRRADIFADLPGLVLAGHTCDSQPATGASTSGRSAAATSPTTGGPPAGGGHAGGRSADTTPGGTSTGGAAGGSPTGGRPAGGSSAGGNPTGGGSADTTPGGGHAGGGSADTTPGGTSTGDAAGALVPRPRPACGCSLPVATSAVVINVHVPVTTLLGLDEAPGELEGYGPISAEHVRMLVPAGRLRRLSVDARTGRPVAVDTAPPVPAGTAEQTRRRLLAMLTPHLAVDRVEPGHDPSARLGRLVDLRDVHCAGPGCARPAGSCDRDHAVPWPAGPTAAANLHLLSRRCHRAKHAGWQVQHHPDGATTWTSPTGRSYRKPSPWEPPVLPDHVELSAPVEWDAGPAPAGEQLEDAALTLPEPTAAPPPAQPGAVRPRDPDPWNLYGPLRVDVYPEFDGEPPF